MDPEKSGKNPEKRCTEGERTKAVCPGKTASAEQSLRGNSKASGILCRKVRGKLWENYPASTENKMGKLCRKWKSEF